MALGRSLLPVLSALLLVGTLAGNPRPAECTSLQVPASDTLVFSLAITADGTVPVLQQTPPWERVWEREYTLYPRIRLGDADGHVWEAVLEPLAVEALVVAPRSPDRQLLLERVGRLFPDPARISHVNLLAWLRSAKIPIRAFIPYDSSDLTEETWMELVTTMVELPPPAEYSLGSVVGEDSIGAMAGAWVDYTVSVAHQLYLVEGHNPPPDNCIKLSDCSLICDNRKR